MKTSILYLSSGKRELDSMEDELPLFIYIITQINIKNPVSEVNFIEDYFKHSMDCIDKESKVLTNFKGAIQFISNIWVIEDSKDSKDIKSEENMWLY